MKACDCAICIWQRSIARAIRLEATVAKVRAPRFGMAHRHRLCPCGGRDKSARGFRASVRESLASITETVPPNRQTSRHDRYREALRRISSSLCPSWLRTAERPHVSARQRPRPFVGPWMDARRAIKPGSRRCVYAPGEFGVAP
jgi:hypothetical protein